ncbi:MAG: hypothetical protein MK334_03360 [SAR202 cluster bacterium]|nr:hypothetical protein [SAR202 cluster bacterium]
MQYIYILSKTGKISESTLEQIKNLYPKSLGKPVEILGNKKVNELPEQYGKETDEICQQECKKNNLSFQKRWDDTGYTLIELDEGVFGICEIYISRYIPAIFTGFGIGSILVGMLLGVTSLSTWIISIALFSFMIYVSLRGNPRNKTEGWIFATGPIIIVGWIIGFMIKDILL